MSVDELKVPASQRTAESAPPMPPDSDTLRTTGNEKFAAGQFREAITYYSKSLEHTPTARVYGNRALCQLKLENFEAAISDADEALALDPTYAKAHHRKGLAYIATKKWKLAKKCFQASLKIEPKSKASKRKLKYCMREINKKRQAFAKALETETFGSLADASSLNNKGNVLYDQGDLSSALEHYRRCLAIQEVKAPGSLDVASCLNNIGNVLCKQGDLSSALEHYRRCLAIQEVKAPGSLDVATCLNNICGVLSQQGDLRANLRLRQQSSSIIASVLGPRSYLYSRNQENIAHVLSKMNQLEEACKHLRQTLATDMVVARSAVFVRTSLRCYRRTCEATGAEWHQHHEQAFCDRLKAYLLGSSHRFPDPKRPQDAFFDYVGHTRMLTQKAKWETSMGQVRRALSCYITEAEEAAALDQHLLALLYLRQALRLAHVHARDDVPDLLRRLSVHHAAVGCPLRAWTLRQQAGALTSAVASATSGSVEPAPQLSRLHQTLEAVRVRFHEMLMDYHLHLATHGKLTAQDENRTGEFFVSFLNLLDKIYSHWGHSALREKGDGRQRNLYFPNAFSMVAWQNNARESQIWGGTILESRLRFGRLRLIDGLLEANYIDSKKHKRWTAKAVAARPTFEHLPHQYHEYLCDLRSMNIEEGRAANSDKSARQVLFSPRAGHDSRWLDMLVDAGVCHAARPVAPNDPKNKDRCAELTEQPLTRAKLESVAANAKEKEAVRWYFAQVNEVVQSESDKGISASHHRAVVDAFLATQSFPYHRDHGALVGSQYGDRVYLAGNANKHLKLTTQHVEQVPEKEVLGSFRRSDTRIMLECPEREVPAWSFVALGLPSHQSRELYAKLREVGVIDQRKVFSFEAGKTHGAVLRVVEAAVRGDSLESAQEEFVKVLMGLTLPFVLSRDMAKKVVDLLVDRALLTAFLKVESNTSVPIRDLIARALDGTQKWLDEVHKCAPIEAGETPVIVPYVVDSKLSVALSSLEAHKEMYLAHREAYLSAAVVGSEWLSHRLQVVQEVEWRVHDLEEAGVDALTASQAEILDDIYCAHHMYEDSAHLHKHHPGQLRKKTHSSGDRDTWCQLSSCQRMLWSIRRYQPGHSLWCLEEVSECVTHVLIKVRALTEQSLDRVCRRLVCWPNHEFPSERLRKLLSAKCEQELTATARQCTVVDGGALDLRLQYPEVWSVLLGFDSLAWDSVTRITDIAKHERGLQVEHTASGLVLVWSEGRCAVLPLLQSFLDQVRVLVEVFNRTQAETEELLSAATQSTVHTDDKDRSTQDDLSRFQGRMPLDRADKAGNTPLHHACRRDDVDQLLTLAQDPVTLRRACRPNRSGETPLTLGNGTCSVLLRRHLDAHALRLSLCDLAGGWS